MMRNNSEQFGPLSQEEIVEYQRWIEGVGPHSKEGKFYRRMLAGEKPVIAKATGRSEEKSGIECPETQHDFSLPPTPKEVKKARLTDRLIRKKGPLWYACILVARYPSYGPTQITQGMTTYWPHWGIEECFFFQRARKWYDAGGAEESEEH